MCYGKTINERNDKLKVQIYYMYNIFVAIHFYITKKKFFSGKKISIAIKKICFCE